MTIVDAAHSPLASVIIPVFNKASLTRQCLASLARVRDQVPTEVIVVDNASSDDTAAMLQDFPWVHVARNSKNLGFAKGCNKGASLARGKYLVFLNNDTILLDGWLEALVDEAEADFSVGMVGSKLLYETGLVQHAGVAFARSTRIPYHPYRFSAADASFVNHRKEMQAVTAASVLIPSEIFWALEGFCEEYQNGWEDLDLCVRMRLKRRKIIYQPKSTLYHLESQTSGRMDRDDQNKALFFKKWSGLLLSDEDAFYAQDGACFAMVPGNVGQTAIRPFRSPREAQAWMLLAETQRAAAEMNVARMRELILQAKAWPEDYPALCWIGLIAHSMGFAAAAETFLRRAQQICDTPEVRIWMAALLRVDNALADAPNSWEHPALLELQAHAAVTNGEWASALNLFSQALAAGAKAVSVLESAARAAEKLGDKSTYDEYAFALAHLTGQLPST